MSADQNQERNHEEEDEAEEEREPHHDLANPAHDPDPTEYPDPYEKRPDPRGPSGPGGEHEHEAGEEIEPEGQPAPHGPSTSEPHPGRHPQPDKKKKSRKDE